MVNALGGVTMDFPDPVKDAYSGLDVTQTGCQLVNGATALELVRARHLYYEATGEWQYDGLSDFSRIQRQDAFFRAVLDKLDAGQVSTPSPSTASSARPSSDLTIDDTLSEGDLISMANEFHGLARPTCTPRPSPPTASPPQAGPTSCGEAEPQRHRRSPAFNQSGRQRPPRPPRAGHSTTTTTAAALAPDQVAVRGR